MTASSLKRHRTPDSIAYVVLAASLLVGAACATTPSAQPLGQGPGAGRSIRIEGAGGGIGGTLYGPSSTRGVLVIAPEDGDAWQAFAVQLGQAGYSVLLYRQPERDGPAAMRAATATLRRQGAGKVVLIAGGRAVRDALGAARDGADGVAALSPSAQPDPVPATGMPSVPVLALASLSDAESSAQARRIYEAAVEPRMLALYPARGPAVAIIGGAEPTDLRSVLLDFLRSAFEPLSALRRRG